jgi:acyl-coenzyme A thioesterase PaaI-like protein
VRSITLTSASQNWSHHRLKSDISFVPGVESRRCTRLLYPSVPLPALFKRIVVITMENKNSTNFNDSVEYQKIQTGFPSQSKPGHDRCFVCGADNPRGLHMNFTSHDGVTSGHFTIRSELESFSGVAHGGILTTLLDSAMSRWLYDREIYALTAIIKVRFRRPVAPGEKIFVEARKKQHRGRRYYMVSRLSDKKGMEVASAEAVFVLQNTANRQQTIPLKDRKQNSESANSIIDS